MECSHFRISFTNSKNGTAVDNSRFDFGNVENEEFVAFLSTAYS